MCPVIPAPARDKKPRRDKRNKYDQRFSHRYG
jgi:hypothetical protein